MPRAKTRVASRQRRKKVLHATRGYFGKKKSSITIAKDAFYRAGVYAFRDRRQRKRQFRSLWIRRINAGARLSGITYGQFISGLKKKGIIIDRKILAHLAAHEPEAFRQLAEAVKK
jgi:large subunit ribosomal protein L20